MAVKKKTEEPAIDDTNVADIVTDLYPVDEPAEQVAEEPAAASWEGETQDQLSQYEEPQPFRERVLDSASDKISGSSEQTYGTPAENFERTAQLWSVLFGHPVSVLDVAIALDLVKTSRLIQSPAHLDSWIDKVGYSALGGELANASS